MWSKSVEILNPYNALTGDKKKEPQTNADRIRAMNDKELGMFLAEWAEKPWTWKRDGEGQCLAWLQSPAE